MCACVCPPLRLLITSGMMWRDIDSMATVVGIIDGHGLGINTHCGN